MKIEEYSYKDFYENEFSKYLDDHPETMDNHSYSKLQLDIDADKIIKYVSMAWNKTESPHNFKTRSYFTGYDHRDAKLGEDEVEYTKKVTIPRMQLEQGYDQQSTRMYIMKQIENCPISQLLGQDNFKKLKLEKLGSIFRILIHPPGTFLPSHYDYVYSGTGLKRYTIMVAPYVMGQFLYIGNDMISNWEQGDCYELPFPTMHGSGNCSHLPKISLTVTGVPIA